MNGVQILATQPWVERLGMTLLHFLWQGAIIFTIYGAARKLGARTFRPNGRYFLACAALTAMAIDVMFMSRCPARYASVHGSMCGAHRVRHVCRSVYSSKTANSRSGSPFSSRSMRLASETALRAGRDSMPRPPCNGDG